VLYLWLSLPGGFVIMRKSMCSACYAGVVCSCVELVLSPVACTCGA
jgi:hypothetical protein